ncbi:MAG: SPFH domain-containing protein, partial [Ktedonobacterales bacterium]|nr:SPFH domain-containing protein [Ktedonobacterales bacterium]
MDSLTRALLIGAPSFVIVLVLLFPNHGLWIVLAAAILAAIGLRIGLHNTPDPFRPLIYRFGQMHRLGQPGVIVLLPFIDEEARTPIDMRPLSLKFDVYQLAASDGDTVYMNLELTWQIRSDVDRIDPLLKQTLLKSPEQRERLVEHTISTVARQLLLNYTTVALKRSDVRESITEILRNAVNELLAPHGLMVETIFWRGSIPSNEYLKAKLAMKIAHEQLELYVQDMALVGEHLPGVDPEA